MTVPSAESPELSKGFPLKLAVGLNATLLASLSGRGSTCLVNAFPVHSAQRCLQYVSLVLFPVYQLSLVPSLSAQFCSQFISLVLLQVCHHSYVPSLLAQSCSKSVSSILLPVYYLSLALSLSAQFCSQLISLVLFQFCQLSFVPSLSAQLWSQSVSVVFPQSVSLGQCQEIQHGKSHNMPEKATLPNQKIRGKKHGDTEL